MSAPGPGLAVMVWSGATIVSWLGRLAVGFSPIDIGLFVQSARTDATIVRLRPTTGQRAAFESVYRANGDPWRSASRRYRYQQFKYDEIMRSLPERRFHRVLDLGCGVGLLSARLAKRADVVIGIDIAEAAVETARKNAHGIENLCFRQGDLQELPAASLGQFDLVVIADTLYYLPPPLLDTTLKTIVGTIGDLLRPGGLCLLANHYFFRTDGGSRVTQQIHAAFRWSERFQLIREEVKPFFLVSVLEAR